MGEEGFEETKDVIGGLAERRKGTSGFLTVTKPNWSPADLRDKSLEESDNLDPDVLAKEIVEDLEAALE